MPEVAYVGIADAGSITGGDGRAEEDLACAEYIAALLGDDRTDPAPFVARAAASEMAVYLREYVRRNYPGVGSKDVDMCLDVDRFEFAMRARVEDGLLALRKIVPG